MVGSWRGYRGGRGLISVLVLVLFAASLSTAAAIVSAPAASAENLVEQQIWAKNADVTWKTLQDGTEQGTQWRQLGFDASGWDDIPFRDYHLHGSVPIDGRGYYYLNSFEITDVWQISAIKAQLYYDDAAVMFLNGQEVYRSIRNNLPTDQELSIIQTIPFGGAENYYVKIPAASNSCERGCLDGGKTDPIDPSLLVEGTNVIGIMAWTTAGSDLGADLGLSLVRDLDATPPGPEIEPVEAQMSELADAINLAMVATTENNPPITWEATGLPDGLSIDAASGVISGSPTTIESTTVTVTASDDVGPRTIEFDWQVENAPPALTSPGPQQTPSFSPVSLQIDAVDPDGGALTFVIDGLPPGITMNETGLITGSSSAEDAYTISLSVTDDEEATEMISFPWQIAEPPINLVNPGDQDSDYGQGVNLTLEATDPAGGNVALTVEGLPDGLSYNDDTKRITGSPSAVGEYNVLVSGMGPSGNSVISFGWVVPNELPAITIPAKQLSVAKIVVVPRATSAVDPDGGDVTLVVSGLPAGIAFDPETGEFTGSATEAGIFMIMVTATDDEGESANRSFEWEVLGIPKPVVINEVVASNDQSLFDEDLDTPDWLELYNPSPISINLEGWTLQDAAGQWTFPAVSIAPGEYKVIFASDKDRAVAGSELHTNFKLSKEGDSLLLADGAGFVIDEIGGNVESGLPRQLTDVSYGVGSGNAVGYLEITTPGAANSALGSDYVPVLRPFTDRLFNQGDLVDESIIAFDPDGDPLTYGLSPAPSGVTLGLFTGALGGTTRIAGEWQTVISVIDSDLRETTQDVNWYVLAPPAGQSALVLNEYNAVSPSSELLGGSDPAFAEPLGNGGDWFEFVVVQDQLDIRGWSIQLWDRDNKDELLENSATLKFANKSELRALPSGTIITISEDRPDDLSLDPEAGDWHINLQSNDLDEGAFITADSQENFNSSRSNQNVVIRNAAGDNVSPAVGETESWDNLVGGVGGGEVMALCVNPVQVHVDPVNDYLDSGLASSYGEPNSCIFPGPDPLIPDDDIPFNQDLSALRNAAQPVEPIATDDVVIAVSCLAGNGRVDTNIVNTGSEAAVYRIEFEGLSPRQRTVAAGDWWRMPITGRPDKAFGHVVKRGGVIVSDTSVTVSCDTEPPELPSPEIQVTSACRSGNGYILFQFVNETDVAKGYIIEFEGVGNRSTTAAAYGGAVRAVTGRPDGTFAVKIRSGLATVDEFDVAVACDQ